MKSVCKLLGGLSLLLLMAGGLLSLTGWLMGGRPTAAAHPFMAGGSAVSRDRREYGPVDWSYDGSDSLEPFHEVQVNLSMGSVTFEPAGDYGVSLAWAAEATGYQLRYKVENGVLSIWSAGNRGLETLIGQPQAEVTVYLPEGAELDRADLELDFGDARLNGFSVKDLTVDADLGEVSLHDVQAGEAGFTLDMGSLTLTDCQLVNGDLTLSMGDLTAQALNVTGRLTVEADMGSVELDGVPGSRTEIDAGCGSVTLLLDLPIGDCGYDLEVDMGGITVDGEPYRHGASRSGGSHYIQAEAALGDIELSFLQ